MPRGIEGTPWDHPHSDPMQDILTAMKRIREGAGRGPCDQLPVGAEGEFVWDGTDEKVGT